MTSPTNFEAANRSALIPQFDRRSIPAYAIIAAMLCIGIPAILISGFTLSPIALGSFPLVALWIVSAGLLRRLRWTRLAAWLEGNAIVYGQALPSLLILAPGASLAFPIADARLAGWDQALGFDWVSTAYTLRPFLRPLWIGYNAFVWEPSLALLLLAAFDQDRMWRYVTAGTGCLLIVALIFPFMPGYGAFHFYNIGPEQYPPLTLKSSPWTWMRGFDKLRSGYKVIDASVMGSLVSFPSYHTVVGALCTWAAWPFKYARYPALLLNAAMIVGALIFGTHHLIDLIAGVALAALAVVAVNRLKWPTEF